MRDPELRFTTQDTYSMSSSFHLTFDIISPKFKKKKRKKSSDGRYALRNYIHSNET